MSASGSVHLFVQTKDKWNCRAKLIASDGPTDSWFGWSVALYLDTVVVGAPGPEDDGNGSRSESVHVFDQGGNKWTHQG